MRNYSNKILQRNSSAQELFVIHFLVKSLVKSVSSHRRKVVSFYIKNRTNKISGIFSCSQIPVSQSLMYFYKSLVFAFSVIFKQCLFNAFFTSDLRRKKFNHLL